jgi:hypothetical protein
MHRGPIDVEFLSVRPVECRRVSSTNHVPRVETADMRDRKDMRRSTWVCSTLGWRWPCQVSESNGQRDARGARMSLIIAICMRRTNEVAVQA